MNPLFLLLVIQFLVISANSLETATPINGEYEVKSFQIQSSRVSMARFAVTYDEPLGIQEITACPVSNYTFDPSSCICDYTLPNACDLCVSCDQTICDSFNLTEWSLVEPGVLLDFNLGPNEILNVRFQIQEPGQALDLRINLLFGRPAVYIDTVFPVVPYNAKWLFQRGWTQRLVVCPTDPRYIPGTYFIQIVGTAIATKGSLEIRSVTVPQISDIADFPQVNTTGNLPEPICSNLTNGDCLVDGVSQIWNVTVDDEGAYFYFQHNFTGCKTFGVGLYIHSEGFSDADIYFDFETPKPSWANSKLGLAQPGADTDAFTYCPPEGQQYSTLYMRVWHFTCGSQESCQLELILTSYTTEESYRIFPLSSINYYDYFGRGGATSNLVINSTTVLRCTDVNINCLEYFHMYPSEDSVPFFPLPPIFATNPIMRDFNTMQNFLYVPFVNNTYMSMIVLNSTTGTTVDTYFKESDLIGSQIEFNLRLVTVSGKPLAGRFSVTRIRQDCDYDSLKETNGEIAEILSGNDNVTGTLNTVEFYKAAAMFKSSAYTPCQELFSSFISTSVAEMQTLSTDCILSTDDPTYMFDPCCGAYGAWFNVCSPRLITVETNQQKINYDLLNEGACDSVPCVTSMLEDYVFFSNNFTCPSAPTDKNAKYLLVRTCKAKYYSGESLECYTDDNCARWNTTCNLQTGLCKVDKHEQAKGYVRCLVESMSLSTLSFVASQLSLVSATSREEVATALLSETSHEDCFDPAWSGISYPEQKYIVQSDDPSTWIIFNCPEVRCEDTSCHIEEDACWTYGRTRIFIPARTSTEASCLSDFYCNWNSTICDGLDHGECETECNSDFSGGFCGWSEDSGLNYVAIPEIADVTSCQQKEKVCVFQSGAAESGHRTGVQPNPGQNDGSMSVIYDVVASDADCTSTFTCSLPCGLDGSTPATATSTSTCADEAQCATTGYCSLNILLHNPNSTDRGACLRHRGVPGIGDPFHNYFLYPYCLPTRGELRVWTTPLTCLDQTVTRSECEADGDVWQEPLKTQDECLAPSQMGCWQPWRELGALNGQFAWSGQADNESCVAAGGTWRNYWEWYGGKWTPGVMREIEWISAPVVAQRNVWQEKIDFNQIQTLVFTAFDLEASVSLKSTSLCSTSLSQDYVATVSCDCGASKGENLCFSDDVPETPVAQSLVCNSEARNLYARKSVLRYGASSVAAGAGCVTVIASSISALEFRGQSEYSLSSHFMDFRVDLPFSFNNVHGASVGIIIGDGLVLEYSREVSGAVEICLALRDLVDLNEISETFSVWDFASSTDGDYTNLVPLGLNLHGSVEISDPEDPTLKVSVLCTEVYNLDTLQNYFPVRRSKNFQDQTRESSSERKTSRILSYLLGAMYALVAGLGILSSISACRSIFADHKKPLLTDVVILFIWIFHVLRSVYFFVIPHGFSSQSADYVLASLPTFLYFSAFSIILAFWGVTMHKKLQRNAQKLFASGIKIAIAANVILYLLFIGIIVGFRVGVKIPEPECGRRSESSLENAERTAKDISLTYGAVTAGISLLFGTTFFVVGSAIMKKFSAKSRSKRPLTLFVLTALFSVSFVLHSIFIILLVSIFNKSPSSVFSFVGLLLTEILPSFTFLVICGRVNRSAFSSTSATSHTGHSVNSGDSSRTKPSRRDTAWGSKKSEEHVELPVVVTTADNPN